MKQILELNKVLSMMLTATMVFNMGLTTAFAEGDPLGKLQCHTIHDENCGYSETTTTSKCTHEHIDCGYVKGWIGYN